MSIHHLCEAPMNLRDLRAFVAVAETGSVNRAAAKLNLTQPAVTRRVQSLEATIGAPLLDRTSKPPSLTEDGRQTLAHGRRILSAIEDLTLQVGSKRGLAGDFRIGIAPGFADSVLGRPLDHVMREFPNINLRIASDWSGELLGALRSQVVDAALVLLTEPQSIARDLELRSFRQEPVVIVAARRAAIAASPRLAELGLNRWVLNPRGCGFRQALQRALDREHGHLNLGAEVQGYDLQLSLIARGVGLGLVPKSRWQSSPQRKETRIVEPRDFRLIVTPAIVTSEGHDRFRPIIDLLVSGIERGARSHHAQLT
jgi:DNA-binding transcriptional LysR family regulator